MTTEKKAVFAPSRAEGSVWAPPSKSDLHRLIFSSCLAKGESVIGNAAFSRDVLASLSCAVALGAIVRKDGENRTVRILSKGLEGAGEELCFPCGECGTTLRFFFAAALAAGKSARFTGSKTLLGRPMQVYEELCRAQGILYENDGKKIRIFGKLKPGKMTVKGNVSSQFISGLLFVLPLIGGGTIDILPPFESRGYVLMTLETQKKRGVRVAYDGAYRFEVPGGLAYAPLDAEAEGDFSNAAFLDAFNLLNGRVKVEGLRGDALQPDGVYPDYFEKLKKGCPTLDLSECPDLGPVCMALAAARGGARFVGTRRLRVKESDRCASMASELEAFGAKTEIKENEMTVFPAALRRPERALDAHNDHRVAMALSLLLSRTGGTLFGAGSVDKSFPGFFEEIKKLGVNCEVI